MGELMMAAPVAGLTSKGRIAPEDVSMLRQEVFADGVVTRGEAEALFALDASCSVKCAEWPQFFVEALSDYIVHQEHPAGYISEENASWLVRSISRDGMVDTVTELELLVAVLEKATSSPEALSSYAMQQVVHAVTDGKGPLARGGELASGCISKAEVDLLRRILYAFGGDGNVGITRAEAEVLFTINDRTVEAQNDPSWSELFVKAVANFMMCSSGYEAPTRQVALRRESFFERADASLTDFFGKMVSGGMRGILEAYAPREIVDDWETYNQKQEATARDAEIVDSGEAKWLVERIGRDQILHDNERALLNFIKEVSPSIHPDLRPLIEKVA
jgi:hypothetical protein